MIHFHVRRAARVCRALGTGACFALLAISTLVGAQEAALPSGTTNTAPGPATSTPQAPGPQTNATAELSFGHEHYSAPLVRLADEGPLILVEGRSRLSGTYRSVAVAGTHMHTFDGLQSVQVNANFRDRNFGTARDLNFRQANVDVMARLPWQSNSIGFGGGVQRIGVGGSHFRQRISLQADLFVQHGDSGFTSIVLDQGNNRHAADNRDLDGAAGLALIRRQFTKPWRGIDEIAVEAGLGRERNVRGNRDFSNRQHYLRMSTDWHSPSLKWSLGVMFQHAIFDAPTLPELPVRRDRLASVDLGVEYSINNHASLRADWSQMINKANTALYESRYRGGSVALLINY